MYLAIIFNDWLSNQDNFILLLRVLGIAPSGWILGIINIDYPTTHPRNSQWNIFFNQ
jgi:hypothetical protein